MGNVSEPATKHFWNKDIYTHVTYADLENLPGKKTPEEEYNEPTTHSISIGDTVTTSNSLVVLRSLGIPEDPEELGIDSNDIAVTAFIEITDVNKKKYEAQPLYMIKENQAISRSEFVDDLGLKITFNKIDPESGKVDIVISEKKSNKRDFIIMKAIIFPQINILWTGCILMIIGTVIAISHRTGKNKNNNTA
jgi:cytochrome c-type biogenesis protein CcmF